MSVKAVIPLTVNKIALSGGFGPLYTSFPLYRSPLNASFTVHIWLLIEFSHAFSFREIMTIQSCFRQQGPERFLPRMCLSACSNRRKPLIISIVLLNIIAISQVMSPLGSPTDRAIEKPAFKNSTPG